MGESIELELPRPVRMVSTFSKLRLGKFDPTMRIDGRVVFRALFTPDGPCTIRLEIDEKTHQRLTVRAIGDGAQWAMVRAPRYAEVATPDPAPFLADPRFEKLVRSHLKGRESLPALHITTVAIAAAIQQRVKWVEALRSYGKLCRAFGEPAPGNTGLRTGPDPLKLARAPTYQLASFGIDRARAERIKIIAGRSRFLESLTSLPGDTDFVSTLQKVPGIGPWTAGVIAGLAFADLDAVAVGDAQLPRMVTWALAREPYGDDDRMLELLEPFRPQRGLAVSLLAAGGAKHVTRTRGTQRKRR